MQNIFDQTAQKITALAERLGVHQNSIEQLKYPQRVIEFYIPLTMDDGTVRMIPAWRSQYNNALGPYKGGIRFHETVHKDEVMALSAWMAIKCAVAGIPMGGGKGGAQINPKELSANELEQLSRGYMRALAPLITSDTDIPAPDVNTNGIIMGWMMDEYAKITGKKDPAIVTGKLLSDGGSQGREVATGFGGAVIVDEVARTLLKKSPQDITVAIQGFGNVGSYLARFLFEKGYSIVSLSDRHGAIATQGSNILNPVLVKQCEESKGRVAGCYCIGDVCDYDEKNRISVSDQLESEVDILIPAALENQITEDNVRRVRAKVIVELANGPISADAERVLIARGIPVVPDVLANAGGVVASYYEWLQNKTGEQWQESVVLEKVEKTLQKAYREVQELAHRHKTDLRSAAYLLAIDRIAKKMSV